MKLALAILAAVAWQLATSEASAATPPSFSINDGSVREGFSISPQITKSAKSSSYSKISCTVTDGTAKAGIDYVRPLSTTITIGNNALVANCPAIATINNQILDGTRTLTVTIKAVRNATIARAQATIQIFDDEVAPTPAPAPTGWVAAPLVVGGYGRLKGFANAGIILKIESLDPAYAWVDQLAAAEPTVRHPLAAHALDGNRTLFLLPDELEGVAPAQ